MTKRNNNYRKVVYTTKNLQLVLMSLKPREEIGMEKHPRTTQFIRIEQGKGVAIIGKRKYNLSDGSALIIPPNKRHNIINTGKNKLSLYTLYSPPEHQKNRIERNKQL